MLDAQLRRPKATLVVTSSPAGAEVRINGAKQGKTPLSIAVQAYEGYNVEVAGAGGRAWKKRVYVKTPSTNVQAMLTPPARVPPPVPRNGPADTMGLRGRGIR